MAVVVYRVGTDLEYAAAQEFGATISPVRAQFLHFTIGGEEVFTKGPVTIPPHPYMRPAFDSAHGAAAKVIGEVFGQLLQAAA